MTNTPFAKALQEANLRPTAYCRAVSRLTGANYSPVMTSRWIQGVYDAPPPAIALAVLLGRLPNEERETLTAAPKRKTRTQRGVSDGATTQK